MNSQIASVPDASDSWGFTVMFKFPVSGTQESPIASVPDTGEMQIDRVQDTGNSVFDCLLFFTNINPLILTVKQKPIKKAKPSRNYTMQYI